MKEKLLKLVKILLPASFTLTRPESIKAMKNLQNIIKDNKKQKLYWRTRCFAAERYLSQIADEAGSRDWLFEKDVEDLE